MAYACFMFRQFIFISLSALSCVSAEEPAALTMQLLRDECMSCHKPGKSKGGLVLNSRDALLKGGDSGAAVVLGNAADSLLYQVLLKEGDPHMPPKKQLPLERIGAVKQWIEGGAVWLAEVLDAPPAGAELELRSAGYTPALALALSPDEKLLAVGHGGGVLIYDLSQPQRPLAQKLVAHPDSVQALAWSPDGAWLATGAYRSIKVWEVAGWRQTKQFHGELVGHVTALCFAGEELWAADGVATQSGFLQRVDYLGRGILETRRAHEDSIYSLARSPDGKTLASGSADKMIKLWALPELKLRGSCEGHVGQVSGLAYDAKNGLLASTSADKEVKVWDTATLQQVMLLGDKKLPVSACAWSGDGSTVVTATELGTATRYTELQQHSGAERGDAAEAKALPGVEGAIHALAVSRDGSTVYAATAGGRVQLWVKGKLLAPLALP
jgi:WD40 repeat protein